MEIERKHVILFTVKKTIEMANVQSILNAAKKQKGGGTQKAQKQVSEQAITASSVEDLDNLFTQPTSGGVESLDYTLYPNGTERKVYDANEEMRELKEGFNYAKTTSNMPKAILDSVLRNPLDMPIPSEIDTKLMSEELQNRTVDIIGKLEDRDRGARVQSSGNASLRVSQPIMESEQRDYQGGESSSSMAAIEKRLARIEKLLASQNGGSDMKLMKIGENSTFMFMDTDNNVFECTMRYKGKGKIKR